MKNSLNHYLQDGADQQSRGVLAFLQPCNIEESWNEDNKRYDAEPTISVWENGREHGYVVSLRSKHFDRQLNIAFFEHRNSDELCAVKWEQLTMNAPNIESAEFGDAYKTKYDTSFRVSYGEVIKMANWIQNELTRFWIISLPVMPETNSIILQP